MMIKIQIKRYNKYKVNNQYIRKFKLKSKLK